MSNAGIQARPPAAQAGSQMEGGRHSRGGNPRLRSGGIRAGEEEQRADPEDHIGGGPDPHLEEQGPGGGEGQGVLLPGRRQGVQPQRALPRTVSVP